MILEANLLIIINNEIMVKQKYLEQLNDAPLILDEKNDILWTNRISDKISLIIKNSFWDKESFVIWLQWARWSWKSSIIETVKKKFDDDISIIDFKPWLYSAKTDLYSKFIDELSIWLWLWKSSDFETLEHELTINKYYQEITWKTFNDIKSFLNLLNYNFSSPWCNFFKIWIYTLFINPILIFFANYLLNSPFLYLILALIPVVLLVYWTKKNMDLLRKIDNFESLSNLKDEVEKLLDDKKLFVIIDDLDRLHPNQIITIFQLVKSTANFKNTVFLLSYDKNIINPILSDKYESKWFLKKIIQLEINIPIIEQNNLYEYFELQLSEAIDEINVQYWTTYYLDFRELNKIKEFIVSWEWKKVFNNIREIKRFINFFKLEFMLIQDYLSKCEIYMYDFIMVRIIEFYDYNLLVKIYNFYSEIVLLWISEQFDLKQKKEFEGYEWWIKTINDILPVRSNPNLRNPNAIVQPNKFLNYFNLKINWVSETDFSLLLYMIGAWSSLTEDFLKELLWRKSGTPLKSIIIDNIKRMDINHKKELDNMTDVIIYILSQEKLFESSYEKLIPWHFHLHDIFREFMNKLSIRPEIYKKIYLKILRESNFYKDIFQLIFYASTYFVDLDYDEIRDMKNMIGEKNISLLYLRTKKVFLANVKGWQLHKNFHYEYIIENARSMWWITSKEVYDYLKKYDLFNKFILDYPFDLTVNNSTKDLNRYVLSMMKIFDRYELLKVINLFKDYKFFNNLKRVYLKILQKDDVIKDNKNFNDID